MFSYPRFRRLYYKNHHEIARLINYANCVGFHYSQQQRQSHKHCQGHSSLHQIPPSLLRMKDNSGTHRSVYLVAKSVIRAILASDVVMIKLWITVVG